MTGQNGAEGKVTVARNITFAESYTIPRNIALDFASGAQITVTENCSLTVDGRIEAGPRHI